ncbi:autotransporter outer membrane beta-barrel domain-containing protein [Sphingomonas montana]|uniref:autotransporter outer membrane beta-barrel domain-containing protein n=1 Tax=Sphingomonas montana TaxID=1843236 RepID=UPI0009700A8B|nr:hypothetical protein [Sphingomonas montana]
MRIDLFTSTAIVASFCMAGSAAAQTAIETRTTTPVRTSTIRAGAPDAIRITTAGSVVPTGGTAVTVDSIHAVVNEGTVQVTDANGAVGIGAGRGTGGGITNRGRIVIDEAYVPVDTDRDGDLDGGLAQGNGRFGIRTDGAYAGTVANAIGGAITVEGNDSAGIWLGGPLTGNLDHSGGTQVIGDRAVGVRTGDVTGNVRLAGTIGVVGRDAVATRIDGAITGALVVQGGIASTGYRSTTLPANLTALDADDLLQGGSAMVVAGNVGGGIVFAVPPANTDPAGTDDDRDGIVDTAEGAAAVATYGAAPAVLIGAADRAVAIGAVAGRTDGFGLVIDGAILGSGVYAGVAGNGLVIGGQSGTTTIAGGMAVAGSVQAQSNGGAATAIRIGSGATVPQIAVSGTVSASGGGAAGVRSTAILIEQGAGVQTIRVTGTVGATASATDGAATAIRDASGTVWLVDNSGTIGASGALATSDRNVAIDLSAATGDVTVRQSGAAGAAIGGAILTGSGNDRIEIATGRVVGAIRTGAGNDALTLTGPAVYNGAADFGGGADRLAIADTAQYLGTLTNAGGLAATVNGGTLRLTAPAAIGSLAVAGKGTLGVALGTATLTTPALVVAGTARFEAGTTLSVSIANVSGAIGRHVAVQAGTLTGTDVPTLATTTLPFLYRGILTRTGNALTVDIARRTAAELGLNRPQTAINDAAYAALTADARIGGVFLGIADGALYRATLNQMLPDQAAGTFEMVTMGSRTAARIIADPDGYFKDQGRWAYWVAPAGWQSKARNGADSGYDIAGWGVSGGAEIKTGIGNFGVTLGYLDGRDSTPGIANRVESKQIEAGGYWRIIQGRFAAHARGSYARVDFDGTRRFRGTTIANEAVDRTATSSWKGDMASAGAGASYELNSGQWFLRPTVAVDYYRLEEGAHTERDAGGTGFALSVTDRTSDELAVTGSIGGGVDIFSVSRDFLGRKLGEGWFRIEAEAGRREIVGGGLGVTTAQFAGGQSFTIAPRERDSGWIGRVRALGGSDAFRLAGEVGAEEREGRAAMSVRASMRISLF